jgi:hypothetical protein
MIDRPVPRSGETLPTIGLATYRAFDVGADAAAREPLQDVLRTLVAEGGKAPLPDQEVRRRVACYFDPL